VPLSEEIREKIALFCDVPKRAVIEGLDTSSVYELPLIFEEQGLADLATERLGLFEIPPNHAEWRGLVERIQHPAQAVTIALVGKYMVVPDAYISVVEAVKHGGIANDCRVTIERVNAEDIEREGAERLLGAVDGVLVPGGFGDRGIQGKIEAIRYARERRVPLLGLCLGMQCSVIEYARHICGLEGAHSAEFSPLSPHPVLDLLPDQKSVDKMGGTMRLGAYPCRIVPGTLAHRLYGADEVFERHRHRYEVNNDYRAQLEAAGMVFSGLSPDGRLVELAELPDHPFFIASQFHPEFKSRPNRAHPLFSGFVQAALEHAGRRGAARPDQACAPT
jgi:CTP synthase